MIELIVVVSIVAILSALAAPMMSWQMNEWNVANSVNTFLADMRFARSEAARRGTRVILCRSNSPEATTPSCSTGNGWTSGWIVFEDRNNSGNYNSGDQLLRVQSPITSLDAATELTSGGSTATNSTAFTFTALGMTQGMTSVVPILFGGSQVPSKQQRVVCVSQSGRVRIAGNGSMTASCS